MQNRFDKLDLVSTDLCGCDHEPIFSSVRISTLCPIPGMRRSSSLLHRDKNTCASAAKLAFEFEGARRFMRPRYVGSPRTPNEVAYMRVL